MAQYPLVSVLIPCHNYGQYVGEAIESVLAQTYPNVEIVLVDDGSTDNTREVVKKYPSVRYIYQEHVGNHTPARAQNTGIPLCKGEFIICMGADDKLTSKYIEECMRVMLKDKKIGMVFTGAEMFGENLRIGNRFLIPKAKTYHMYNSYQMSKGVIGTGLVPKKAHESIGGYDETLTSALEDWDIVIRLMLKNWKIKSTPKPLYLYRMHNSNIHNMISEKGLSQLYPKYPTFKTYMEIQKLLIRIYRLIAHPIYSAKKIRTKLIHQCQSLPS